jgi:class 3 adenylate cyclase
MQSSYKPYSHLDSVTRIDEILDAPAGNYEEKDSIPSRDTLTFTNGFYVNCTCIYMDIKGSSDLPNKHQRPRLAKIYRSFISESVALLNGSTLCSEVNIHGDAVWAVYEGQYKSNIDSAFNKCAELSSLVKILNCRLKKRSIDGINVGIGADWGRALMIKAGYKGSGINEVVWMGDVVNGGANMCKEAKNHTWSDAYICVSQTFFSNLNKDNQKLLSNSGWGWRGGSVVNVGMEDWWKANCTNQ